MEILDLHGITLNIITRHTQQFWKRHVFDSRFLHICNDSINMRSAADICLAKTTRLTLKFRTENRIK